uniref:Uncharacterized protein n=1 Tax=Rhizoctonia solani partitivirus 6 TaxID=2600109 RepID=A0A5Q0TKA0_9VIRU|nr:hypothetical protein [Rhizoctonia solani partitivirus 6]
MSLQNNTADATYHYFDSLSKEVISQLSRYYTARPRPPPTTILHTLKICLESELYLPRSGALFPRRDLRIQFLTNPNLVFNSNEFTENRRMLRRFCDHEISLRYLNAVRFHFEHCQSAQHAHEFTPCAHIYAALISIAQNPKVLRLPYRSNIEMVYMNCASAFATCIATTPHLRPHYFINSGESSLVALLPAVASNTLVDLLAPVTGTRNLRSNTFQVFFGQEENDTDQLPSIPDAPGPSPTQTSPASQPAPAESPSTLHTQRETPGHHPPRVRLLSIPSADQIIVQYPEHLDNEVPIGGNIHDCIINGFNALECSKLLKEARLATASGNPVRKFITRLVEEFNLLHNQTHIFDTNPGHIDIDTARRLVHRLIAIRDTPKPSRRHPERRINIEETRLREWQPLIWATYQYYITESRFEDVPHLRRITCSVLPSHLVTHLFYESFCILAHLAEYIHRDQPTLYPDIIRTESDLSTTSFMEVFPKTNLTSFRLLNYYQEFDPEDFPNPHPSMTVMREIATAHQDNACNWFTIPVRHLGVYVNGRLLRSLKSTFESDYRREIVTVTSLHNEEKTILRRLRFPRHFWSTSVQPREYDSDYSDEIAMDLYDYDTLEQNF